MRNKPIHKIDSDFSPALQEHFDSLPITDKTRAKVLSLVYFPEHVDKVNELLTSLGVTESEANNPYFIDAIKAEKASKKQRVRLDTLRAANDENYGEEDKLQA